MKYQFVQSRYKSRWTGIILHEIPVISKEREYNSAVVLVVKCANGEKPRKRILKVYSTYWLNTVKHTDISWINKDWFKPAYVIDKKTYPYKWKQQK